MQSTRACLAAIFAAALLCLLAAGGAQAARSVTGISYQGDNQDLPSGAQVFADNMGAKFQHVRFIVPWNVALLPAGHYARAEMQRWYDRHVGRQELLVSLNVHNTCEDQVAAGNLSPCTPAAPSAASLANAFRAFRTAWPQVRQFTAWNEPNHTVQGRIWNGSAWSGTASLSPTAARAAEYFAEVHGICATTGTCTVYAGDFADGDAMGAYPGDYKRALGGIVPAAWAVHPYVAVNRGLTSWLTSFYTDIAGSRPVWFTEVGVMACGSVDGSYQWYSEASQSLAAQRLVNLMAARDPARTYYYMLSGAQSAGSCTKWDTGLLYDDPASAAVDAQPRTAFAVLFPELAGSWWALRDSNSNGPITRTVVFPRPGTPVAADWDSDGRDTPGSFLNGSWWLRSAFGSGGPDNAFQYGDAGHRPVAGDWNKDGADTVGVFTPVNLGWHLRDENTAGNGTTNFTYGFSDGIPLSGDWNGDGYDTIGIYRPGELGFYLRDSNTAGTADTLVHYGLPGGIPVGGDWDGDGRDTIGMFDPATGTWYLRNSNTPGIADITFYFGGAGDKPVVGDWDGDGVDTVGIVR